MGCPKGKTLIAKYKPKIKSCEITLCEALANMIADVWDETITYPGFMLCLYKKFVGGKTIKPSDLGLPKLDGASVRKELQKAGYPIHKLGWDPALDANTEDNFRHIIGALVVSLGFWPIGDNLTKALQDSSNTRQHNEAKKKLKALMKKIGKKKPTKAEKKRITRLKDRMAETLSENAANHKGRKLAHKFPWTIFNSRTYILKICLQVLCAECCKDKKHGADEEHHKSRGKNGKISKPVEFFEDAYYVDRCFHQLSDLDDKVTNDEVIEDIDLERVKRFANLPDNLKYKQAVSMDDFVSGPRQELMSAFAELEADCEMERIRKLLKQLNS